MHTCRSNCAADGVHGTGWAEGGHLHEANCPVPDCKAPHILRRRPAAVRPNGNRCPCRRRRRRRLHRQHALPVRANSFFFSSFFSKQHGVYPVGSPARHRLATLLSVAVERWRTRDGAYCTAQTIADVSLFRTPLAVLAGRPRRAVYLDDEVLGASTRGFSFHKFYRRLIGSIKRTAIPSCGTNIARSPPLRSSLSWGFIAISMPIKIASRTAHRSKLLSPPALSLVGHQNSHQGPWIWI